MNLSINLSSYRKKPVKNFIGSILSLYINLGRTDFLMMLRYPDHEQGMSVLRSKSLRISEFRHFFQVFQKHCHVLGTRVSFPSSFPVLKPLIVFSHLIPLVRTSSTVLVVDKWVSVTHSLLQGDASKVSPLSNMLRCWFRTVYIVLTEFLSLMQFHCCLKPFWCLEFGLYFWSVGCLCIYTFDTALKLPFS